MKDKARRSRPFSPPLRNILAFGSWSRIAARSLSSRDIRFSDAVKVPCDRGDGRTGRGVAELLDKDVAEWVVDEAVVVERDGDKAESRDDAVEPEDDEDVLR